MNPTDSFRDRPSTISSDNHRAWIYAKKPSGKWTNYRAWVAYASLAIFIIIPFLKAGNNPVFLFNIIERKFFIFGQIFWPSDFPIVVSLGLIFFVFIILFTVIFGRVWCGWTCPQTILMEMVFRRIEYFFEGDFNQQKKLDQMPWNKEKLLRKGAKHFFYAVVSIIMGHISMAYLVGIERVQELATSNPFNNISGFIGITAFTIIFYLVFAKVREVVCTVICPYGRLQSVLINSDTVVVAYDHVRGEPRGKLDKSGTQNLGDCIDCKLCVQVCPTGIDIRNGTQMECVNCTACIDACNEVMVKIKKPKGLIRFDSMKGILTKSPFRFTARIVAYSLVLTGMIGIFGFLVASRTEVEAKVMRVPGTLYESLPNGNYSNIYNMQIINKTNREISLEIETNVPGATVRIAGGDLLIPAQGSLNSVFVIELPSSEIKAMKTNLDLVLKEGNIIIDKKNTKFLGPAR